MSHHPKIISGLRVHLLNPNLTDIFWPQRALLSSSLICRKQRTLSYLLGRTTEAGASLGDHCHVATLVCVFPGVALRPLGSSNAHFIRRFFLLNVHLWHTASHEGKARLSCALLGTLRPVRPQA